MVELNWIDDSDEISPEARNLIEEGVIPVKCYPVGNRVFLKVNTRLEIDVCNYLVNAYGIARFGRPVAKIGIGDYMRGYLEYWF